MESENYSDKILSKPQVQAQFTKLFSIQANSSCFECGKKTKQWAQKNHSIFLCLNCAALYKQIPWATQIKSITLDIWNKQEVQFLSKGGNQRFKEFLKKYQLQNSNYKDKIKSKAAEYYRIMLKQQYKGHQVPEELTVQKGKEQFRPQISITDMTMDQLLESAKGRASWLGGKTKQISVKAYDKVHHKVTSGQLKRDAKEVAHKVSTNAKYLWGALVHKFQQVTKKQHKQKQNKPQTL